VDAEELLLYVASCYRAIKGSSIKPVPIKVSRFHTKFYDIKFYIILSILLTCWGERMRKFYRMRESVGTISIIIVWNCALELVLYNRGCQFRTRPGIFIFGDIWCYDCVRPCWLFIAFTSISRLLYTLIRRIIGGEEVEQRSQLTLDLLLNWRLPFEILL
jgi:hypothetical protein